MGAYKGPTGFPQNSKKDSSMLAGKVQRRNGQFLAQDRGWK
jgi:hypothetical protein